MSFTPQTDQELLELAAKAAGIRGTFHHGTLDGEPVAGIFTKIRLFKMLEGHCWNPLTDDSDAFRLMASLQMSVLRETLIRQDCVSVVTEFVDGHLTAFRWAWEPVGKNLYAATRRAIVRAAAKIGQQ